MSSSNLERVQEILDHWSEGDFSFVPEAFDSEIEFVMGSGFPDSGTYLGLAGVQRYTRNFVEPWVKVTISPVRLEEVGDAVVSEVHQHGIGIGSGAETSLNYWIVWTFRDGVIVHWQNYRERDEAYDAAGSAN